MFMKKVLKILFIIIGIIVVLGVVFFIVDYNRVQKQEKPIFCIQNPAGIINDGGTIEYFGLGYKVIDFHTLAGFDDIKIGSWSMDYYDFEEEMKIYEMKFEENGVIRPLWAVTVLECSWQSSSWWPCRPTSPPPRPPSPPSTASG